VRPLIAVNPRRARRARHLASQTLFGPTPSPETHLTVYRTILPSFCMFLCLSFVLDFPLLVTLCSLIARAETIRVLVFNPLAWLRPKEAKKNPLDAIDDSFPIFLFACRRRLKSPFYAPLRSPSRVLGFSGTRPVSFSPRAFAFPSGSRTRIRSQNYPRTHKRGFTTCATATRSLHTIPLDYRDASYHIHTGHFE